MSFSGKFTPLQLNVLSSFTGVAPHGADVANNIPANPNGEPEGLEIANQARLYQGGWSAATGTLRYTPGTVVTSTSLSTITTAIATAYTNLGSSPTQSNVNIYRRLLKIGEGVCPALGNSRPSTFLPTYAGYGSWASLTEQASGGYPPKNYPEVNAYSYVSQLTGVSGKRAWIYSWPAKAYTTGGQGQISGWQKSTDSYKAILEPSTTDGLNSITISGTQYNNEYDEYFKDGFIGTIAKQAYYEMWRGSYFSRFNLFCDSFQKAYAFKEAQNKRIASLANSKSFKSGLYSNMDDLTTSDISGVSIAFAAFGNDLLKTGRVIDLSQIHKFGLPSVLLRTLQDNKCLTQAVKIAMTLYSDLQATEVLDILSTDYTPTNEQEVKLYKSFGLITGADLDEILFSLNCKTEGITYLSDLLDIKKLMPTSYTTLTLPEYNLDRNISNSAKIYKFIFSGSGANPSIKNWGTYLEGILTPDLVLTNGAFSMTMQQIKFIRNMKIEKFAQIVANLELVTKDLNLLATTNGVAVNIPLVDNTLNKIALGTGADGTFKMADFFGAAAGYPYVDFYYSKIISSLNALVTPQLKTVYDAILTAANASDWTTLDAKITEANSLIAAIKANKAAEVDQLNFMWDKLGSQLATEQQLQPYVNDSPQLLLENVPEGSIESFVSQIEAYAVDNSDGQSARILALLADRRYVGGQSLIAAIREARNATRLERTDGELQNDVSNYVDTCAASAVATVVNGAITAVTINTPGAGYSVANPPSVMVYPVNVDVQATFTPKISTIDGSVTSIVVTNGGKGYNQDTVRLVIESPPQCQYSDSSVQQSLVDTPWGQLVEPELIADTSSQLDVQEAIAQVTLCNCDCWDV